MNKNFEKADWDTLTNEDEFDEPASWSSEKYVGYTKQDREELWRMAEYNKEMLSEEDWLFLEYG